MSGMCAVCSEHSRRGRVAVGYLRRGERVVRANTNANDAVVRVGRSSTAQWWVSRPRVFLVGWYGGGQSQVRMCGWMDGWMDDAARERREGGL